MTCLGAAPQTAADWFAAIDKCATAYGGPEWPQLAVTGLAALVVIAALVLLVGVIAWGVGR